MILERVYPKRVGPSTLTASAVTYFTADQRYAIERFTFANWTATDRTATLYVVPSGQSVGNSYKVLGEITVPANDTTTVVLPVILDSGDFISALASATSSINLVFNVNKTETSVQ